MKRLLKKKISFFGKEVSVFVVVLLAVGLVSAMLIGSYGIITGNATVTQGLLVDGLSVNGEPSSEDITDTYDDFTSLESPVFFSVHYLENDATMPAEVSLDMVCLYDTDVNCDVNQPAVNYYETNLRSGSLILSKKTIDGSVWTEVEGDDDVTVAYSTNVATGVMTIDDIVGLPDGYTLIYYADEEFDEDGVRLVTPGQAYTLDINSVVPISSADGNLKEDADYCTYDGYDHCRGIKLWAIDDALLENAIVWTSDWQTAYYFETDMLGWNHNVELTSPFDVPAVSELDFVIVSDFPQMMLPSDYKITTTVNA